MTWHNLNAGIAELFDEHARRSLDVADGLSVHSDPQLEMAQALAASAPCVECDGPVNRPDRRARYCSPECHKRATAPVKREQWRAWAARNPRRRCAERGCRAMVRAAGGRCPRHVLGS